MKPGSRDFAVKVRISGVQLRELKRHVGLMAEAFGLDRKIDEYVGTRPISLWRWDLECLLEVIDIALHDRGEYPDEKSPAFRALQSLGERLRQEYVTAYEKE